MAHTKPFRSSPLARSTPVHMLAEKNVNPSMMKNMGQKPLRALAGTRSAV